MTAGRIRQRQADRTARTREALLNATVETLAERGFGGTTTTEVARRAGVSRGAQLHHFPSKLDLIASSLDHVFAEQQRAFRDRFFALDPSNRTQADAVALFAELSRSPHQQALLELVFAARTDDQLRPLAADVLHRFEGAITSTFAEVLPAASSADDATTRVLVAMAVLQSASLHRGLGLGHEAEELESALHALAEMIPLAPAHPTLPAHVTTELSLS